MTVDVIDSVTSTEAPQETISVLGTLVGEGKKYDSPEALAQSRIEADKFIEQLKFENKGMRDAIAELEGRVKESTTLDAVLQRLNQQPEGQGANNQGALNPELVSSLVREALVGESKAAVALTNKKQVNESILNSFQGNADAARDYIRKHLAEVGVDPDTFKQLSEKSPQAALRLININATQESRAPSPNAMANVNTEAFPINPTGKRDFAYYTQVKKQMGMAKFFGDTKLQQQMLKDAEAMGAAFYKK